MAGESVEASEPASLIPLSLTHASRKKIDESGVHRMRSTLQDVAPRVDSIFIYTSRGARADPLAHQRPRRSWCVATDEEIDVAERESAIRFVARAREAERGAHRIRRSEIVA